MPTTRKTTEELIAEEEKKVEQLKARMAELKARQRGEDRRRENHRKIVVGAAIMAHIRVDPQFRTIVRDALNKAITEPKHRNVIPDLLDEQAFLGAMRAAAKKAANDATEANAVGGPVGGADKQPAPETRPPQQLKGGPATPGRKSA
jgi:hypothetical protein